MAELLCLLVDDDQDDQEIFKMVLNRICNNAMCIFAFDGVDALKQMNDAQFTMPDIIFIDVNMPRMNGIELLTEIKKTDAVKNIPVFMYSTSAENKLVEQCNKLGANGFIEKQASLLSIQQKLTKTLQSLNLI